MAQATYKNKKQNGDDKGTAGVCLQDLAECLEDFTENVEDTEMSAPANISHYSDSERPMKVAPRKHSIESHFPKDKNCEVCKRSKITRAPCRRRPGESVPLAEKFSDLITADHKVFSEGSESRNYH